MASRSQTEAQSLQREIKGDRALRSALAKIAPDALDNLARMARGEVITDSEGRAIRPGDMLGTIRTVLEWGYAKPAQESELRGAVSLQLVDPYASQGVNQLTVNVTPSEPLHKALSATSEAPRAVPPIVRKGAALAPSTDSAALCAQPKGSEGSP